MGGPGKHAVHCRARELWPLHPYVWNARLIIFAFTGQTRAARLLLDDEAIPPAMLTPVAVDTWRSSLQALDTRSPVDIATARDTNLAAAPGSAGMSVHAIMVLSELGEVDAAWSIVDALLLRRGDLVARASKEPDRILENDPQWRQTQWMFTPATRALRNDPRFPALCDAIGLSDYWRQRGVGPASACRPSNETRPVRSRGSPAVPRTGVASEVM